MKTGADKTMSTARFANFKSNRKYSYKFDFEIGYLVKSPCRGCDFYKRFPGCVNECQILDKIQTTLAESMSCRR